VPNPFQNLEPERRSLLNPAIYEMVVELAKLDGAFVARGDGFVQTAGAYLAVGSVEVRLPQGLGARHLAAAAITAVTHATAVVVSATDGNVRVYSHGELVLQVEPGQF
jgi:DNA integrity scanning protein DisA with diadenylate cyclase activity